MSQDLAHYVVTGASSGIGEAVAKSLVSKGHRVTGLSRRPVAFESELAHSIGCDFSDLDSVGSTLKQLDNNDVPLGVINCHGYGDFATLEQFSEKRIRRLIDTNLTSAILVAKYFLPMMKTNGSGTLVLIGSEAALRGGQQGAVYAASKFGLRGLAQSLREECSGSGVRVSLINPGMVNTPFFDSLNFTPGNDVHNALMPDEVANAVMSVIDAPANAVIDEINLSPLKKVVQKRK